MICLPFFVLFVKSKKKVGKLLWPVNGSFFRLFGRMEPFFFNGNALSRQRRAINILIYGNRDILCAWMSFFLSSSLLSSNAWIVIYCVNLLNWARKMGIETTTRWWLSQISTNNVGTIRRLSASFDANVSRKENGTKTQTNKQNWRSPHKTTDKNHQN